MMLLLVFASFTTWSVIPSSWGFQSSVFFGVMIGGSETSTYVRAQRATSKCEGSALAQSISLTLLHRAGCYEPSATVPADVSNYGTCTGWDGHDKGCGDEHQPAGDVKLGLGANVSIDGTGSGQVVGRDGCGQGYGNELQPVGSVERDLGGNEHQPAGDVKLGLGANVSIDGTGYCSIEGTVHKMETDNMCVRELARLQRRRARGGGWR
jgi:hypothetical protein